MVLPTRPSAPLCEPCDPLPLDQHCPPSLPLLPAGHSSSSSQPDPLEHEGSCEVEDRRRGGLEWREQWREGRRRSAAASALTVSRARLSRRTLPAHGTPSLTPLRGLLPRDAGAERAIIRAVHPTEPRKLSPRHLRRHRAMLGPSARCCCCCCTRHF